MNTKKKLKYQDRLAAYTYGIAGCGAALATGADAAVVDVMFEFGTQLSPDDESNTSSSVMGAAVGNIGFYAEPTFMSLFAPNVVPVSSGFYHNSSIATPIGLAMYEDTGVESTFGNGSLPNPTGTNTAYLHAQYNAALDLGNDTSGVIGFRTDSGNWGYIEFEWDEASSTLTVLSAKVETEVNTPITFTPIPEPSVMGLLSLGAVGLLMHRRRKSK